MSTIKVNKIEHTGTTAGGVEVDSSGHVQVDGVQMPTAGPLSNRNKIINGNMRIDQRNSGSSVTADNSFAVDRFVFRTVGGGAITAQQSTTAPSGFVNSYSITVSTADSSIASTDNYQLVHRIEGNNTADLMFGTYSAKTVTLSFWVRSSVTGTFGGTLQNNAADSSYVFQYTINTADTWEYKTITVAGDTSGTWLTTNAAGVCVTWDLGSGTDFEGTANSWNAANKRRASGNVQLIGQANATLFLTGVQLEVGEKATPFEHRSYSDELARCHRYYYKIGPSDGTDTFGPVFTDSATASYLNNVFPVPMRADPTALEQSGTASDYVVRTGGSSRTCSSVPVTDSTTNKYAYQVKFTVSSGQTTGHAGYVRSADVTTAFLAWSAEL